MSQETMRDLNSNTLIGFKNKRGTAWHYREDLQGDESNHYEGAVPIEDVRRRLFNWRAVEGEITATALTDDGVVTCTPKDRKAIMRSDTGDILGIFKDGYQIHQYDEWLLKQVASILDDDLQIGSAGLLKNGAVAWVSVEVPESITTPEGVVFRPFLLAGTSMDGTLSTTYKRHVQAVVCDNTMSVALGEKGQEIKVKHSRFSGMKLADARAALEIVHNISDTFAAQVRELTAQRVSAGDWAKFLDEIAPVTERDGQPMREGRGLTMAQNKRDTLNRLYEHDDRCAPWKGTAWGVVQTMNTFAHHEQIVRGGTRSERNMWRAVSGAVDTLDSDTYRLLQGVL